MLRDGEKKRSVAGGTLVKQIGRRIKFYRTQRRRSNAYESIARGHLLFKWKPSVMGGSNSNRLGL